MQDLAQKGVQKLLCQQSSSMWLRSAQGCLLLPIVRNRACLYAVSRLSRHAWHMQGLNCQQPLANCLAESILASLVHIQRVCQHSWVVACVACTVGRG